MFFVRSIVVVLSFEFLFDLVIEIAEMFGNELINALSLDIMLPDWGTIVEFCMTILKYHRSCSNYIICCFVCSIFG